MSKHQNHGKHVGDSGDSRGEAAVIAVLWAGDQLTVDVIDKAVDILIKPGNPQGNDWRDAAISDVLAGVRSLVSAGRVTRNGSFLLRVGQSIDEKWMALC